MGWVWGEMRIPHFVRDDKGVGVRDESGFGMTRALLMM